MCAGGVYGPIGVLVTAFARARPVAYVRVNEGATPVFFFCSSFVFYRLFFSTDTSTGTRYQYTTKTTAMSSRIHAGRHRFQYEYGIILRRWALLFMLVTLNFCNVDRVVHVGLGWVGSGPVELSSVKSSVSFSAKRRFVCSAVAQSPL